MKNILIVIFLMFSFGLSAQSFESKLTPKQRIELAILTEDCEKSEHQYKEVDGKLYPVYIDRKQRSTCFYVKVEKGHVITRDCYSYARN